MALWLEHFSISMGTVGRIPSIHIKALRSAQDPRVLEAEKEFLGKPVSKVSKTDKGRVQ